MQAGTFDFLIYDHATLAKNIKIRLIAIAEGNQNKIG
jgi:hypothetical protein